MATEVFLMADIPHLGSEGDVATVNDGYARNCLFPQKLAVPVTPAAQSQLEKLRSDREDARKREVVKATEMAAKLTSASCTIPVKTGEDDRLYGSVTASDIADVLKDQGIEIDRHALQLEAPIKELGVFEIPVTLNAEVESSVKVWVVEE